MVYEVVDRMPEGSRLGIGYCSCVCQTTSAFGLMICSLMIP